MLVPLPPLLKALEVAREEMASSAGGAHSARQNSLVTAEAAGQETWLVLLVVAAAVGAAPGNHPLMQLAALAVARD